MSHLLLTSALLFALLAIVGIAIGACLGIARDLMLDEAEDTPEVEPTPGRGAQIGLAEDFGIGLRHATNFAPRPGRSFSSGGSLNT